MNLRSKLFLRFSLGPVLIAALLFVSAGSLKFWQGWTYMALVSIPLIASVGYFYKHDPKLMERRLQSKETVSEQERLMRWWKAAFLLAFLLPGLDYRFGWSRTLIGVVPPWLILFSDALVLCGFLLVIWVMKVNSFAARTIQVEPGQKVITTGPYHMVRHPMYSAGLIISFATPLALGSYIAWPVFALLIPFYVFRLLNEEKVLRQELPGYSEYCARTHFRLVPFVW